jgi:hypothetical protein
MSTLSEQIKQVKAALDAATTEAQTAKKAFNDKRTEVVNSGADLTTEDSPAYKALADLDTVRCAADEKASQLQQRYVKLVEMENGPSIELGDAPTPGASAFDTAVNGMLAGGARADQGSARQPRSRRERPEGHEHAQARHRRRHRWRAQPGRGGSRATSS